MSNGYYRFARIDTDDGHIVADEGWGSYPEISLSVLPVETADRSAVIQEISLTREQWDELLQQWNEYREAAAAGSQLARFDPVTADELPF